MIVLTANLRTKILDFRGFHSSRILILRGGIPRPIRDSPESLSQAILAWMMLVGIPRPVGDFPEDLSQTILVGMILVGRLGVRFVYISMCVCMCIYNDNDNHHHHHNNNKYICIYIYIERERLVTTSGRKTEMLGPAPGARFVCGKRYKQDNT